MGNNKNRWTEEDIQFLLSHKNKSAKYIATALGRSESSIYLRRSEIKKASVDGNVVSAPKKKKNKSGRPRIFTDDDINFALANRAKGHKWIARKMGKKTASIYNLLWRYDKEQLKKKIEFSIPKELLPKTKKQAKKKWKNKLFTPDEIIFSVDNRKKGIKWIANKVGRKKSAIYNLLWRYDKGQLKIKPADEFPVVREAMQKDVQSITEKSEKKSAENKESFATVTTLVSKRFRLFWGLIDIQW